MAYLIGTDEAGYGPFLGPLVITATGWVCPRPEIDLYDLLRSAVSASPKELKLRKQSGGILIADSKVANRSGKIDRLERTVLVLLKVVFGRSPKTLADLVSLVAPRSDEDPFANHFWLKDTGVNLPLDQPDRWEDEADQQAQWFRETCDQNQIRLTEINSTIIQPPEFNAGVARHGNKASLLSYRTLKLIDQSLLNRSRSTPVSFGDSQSDPSVSDCDSDLLIECDKHGGRNYYAPVIAQTLTHGPVGTILQSADQSIYRFDRAGARAEIRFTAKGESQMAVALSSMVSKYLREVFMKAWNDFWQGALPGIKSTKGYPQDARRFLSEINHTANAKRIFRNEYWRNC